MLFLLLLKNTSFLSCWKSMKKPMFEWVEIMLFFDEKSDENEEEQKEAKK